MTIKLIDEVGIKSKTVFLRADLDNSQNKDVNIFNYKINYILDTVNYILENDAKLVIASHISIPTHNFDKNYSLETIAEVLSDKISRNIYFPENCVGDAVKKIKNEMRSGEVMLLENLMFHPSEVNNDSSFAKKLSDSVDVYVNESFSLIDRNYASNNAILSYIPDKCAGFSFVNDIKALDRIKEYEGDDLVIYFGGNNIAIKLDFLETYLDRLKMLFLGGDFLYSFLYSMGYSVNKQFVDESCIFRLKKLFSSLKARNKKILVPDDYYVSSLNSNKDIHPVMRKDLNDEMRIHGFGSITAENYENSLKQCNFILWDGQLGIYEEYQSGFNCGKLFPSLVNNDGFVILLSEVDIIMNKNELCYSDKIYTIISKFNTYNYLLGNEFESLAKLQQP